ncbi:MAG: hypothetical protein GFH27_549293n299 [Chloroflexi bacterium AL-W]|nr:hypothetical protein [Chloroflexi bacterium AL-N1]NOK67586.1 hypothetical protein [Chloroflexi bacterium AL-N10]NOK75644.1 hypothetical protein [Chloroflexi bacterium AL-N5]NOK82432.1 hypothetical protein [Chloroflexi bacterium AL-W]NOK90277.1 hypothetical protein [Chloroflexi bacterium AL-N15]
MQLGQSATDVSLPAKLPWWLTAVIVVALLGAGLFVAGDVVLWSVSVVPQSLLLWLIIPAMLLLPGLALLRLGWFDSLAFSERWPLAVGISCVVPPLLLLFSEILGIRWNSWLCWGYLAIALLMVLWPFHQPTTWRSRVAALQPTTTDMVLLLMCGVALMVQSYNVRDLVVGSFGDSYHHTMIAQLLVDNGGLFSSWQPYAPLTTFTYHYGYHSNVAWLHWLTNVPVTQSIIIIGQVQTALTIPLIYLLTRRLVGNERAALWAALLAGFISLMPSYYVNWGRYTQLAGHTVLIATAVTWMALLHTALERPLRRTVLIGLSVLAGIMTSGMALTHYRVTVFVVCFVGTYGLYLLLAKVRSWSALWPMIGVSVVVNVITIVTLLPWLIRWREGSMLRVGAALASTNVGTGEFNNLPSLDNLLSLFASPFLFVCAFLGVGVLIWQRCGRGLVLVGWAALVWVVANPYLIGLNGAGIISNFAVILAIYLVLAPLGGVAIAAISSSMLSTVHAAHLNRSVQMIAGTVLLLWGVSEQQQVVDPQFQLFTQADAAAMKWIVEETPPDATFFVNSFGAYGNSIQAGSDGGWWLWFMTDRKSNLPPILHGMEAAEQPGYQSMVHEHNEAINQHSIDSPEAVSALHTGGYTYLYDGPADTSPNGETINPEMLAQSDLYDSVYDQDGVTIWRIR